MIDLKFAREKIDRIDSEIWNLFKERLSIAREIGKYKLEMGLQIEDSVRENEVLQNKIAEFGDELIRKEFIEKVYRCVFEESKLVQQSIFSEEDR